jgi:hypothetical protein
MIVDETRLSYKEYRFVVRFATPEPPTFQVENTMPHNAEHMHASLASFAGIPSTPTLNSQTTRRSRSRVAAATESYFSFCSSPIRGGLLLFVLVFPSRD